MSSLLELIARRRRASAGKRLGPPPGSVVPGLHVLPPSQTNGHGANGHGANGHVADGQSANGNGQNGHASDYPLSLPVLVWPPEPEALTEPPPEAEEVASPPGDAPVPIPVRGLPRYETWLPPAEEISPVFRPPLEAPQPPAEAGTAPAEAETPPAEAEPEAATSEPEESAQPGPPGFVARGPMRRRARYLRRLRELQFRDIGGFALELHRYGRERPDLVAAKVARVAEIDRELRALERALTGQVALRELREAGIGGVCPSCGAVHGSEDRFCAACGTLVAGSPGGGTPSPDAGPPEAG